MLYYVMKNKFFFNLIIGFILIQFQSCINDCKVSFGGEFENKSNHIIKIVTIDKKILQTFFKLDSFQTLSYYLEFCLEPRRFQFSDGQPQFSIDLFLNADSVKVIFDDEYFYYIYKNIEIKNINSELGNENVNRDFFLNPSYSTRTFTELNYEYAKKQSLK